MRPSSFRIGHILRCGRTLLRGGATLSVVVFAASCNASVPQIDPLPSWHDGPARTAILDFVRAVTTEGSAYFVTVPQRIAVFDNDGTLWSEQPMYFQLLFVMDRVQAMSSDHPEWKTTQPFKAALEGDMKTLVASGEKAILQMLMATHTGTTIEDFDSTVRHWMDTARHPISKVGPPADDLPADARSPGLSAGQWLQDLYRIRRRNEFMRPWVEQVYGIPPEQVVGSRGKLKYELREGRPSLFKLPEVEFVDDGPGKPVGIRGDRTASNRGVRQL